MLCSGASWYSNFLAPVSPTVYSVLHAVKYLFGRPVNCGVVKTIRMADDHIAGTPGQDRNPILTPHIKVREYILIESRVTP